MVASDYRHSIIVTLEKVIGQGDRGQDVYAITTIGKPMAKIEPLAGRKLELARQVVATCTHEITIRYLAGCVPECKLSYGTRTFNVGAVRDKLENKFEQILLVTENV